MEQRISDCIITISDEEFDYIDSFFEHPEVKATRKAEQVLKEYFEMSLKPFDDDILPF